MSLTVYTVEMDHSSTCGHQHKYLQRALNCSQNLFRSHPLVERFSILQVKLGKEYPQIKSVGELVRKEWVKEN